MAGGIRWRADDGGLAGNRLAGPLVRFYWARVGTMGEM